MPATRSRSPSWRAAKPRLYAELAISIVSPEPDTYVSGVTTLRAEIMPRMLATRVAQVLFFADGEIPMTASDTKVRDEELAILASGKASVVYCPRTHAYFNHPPHRWRDMLALGVNVALGTDSCASSPDLNLVDDLRLVHGLAPDVPPHELWQLFTTRAAQVVYVTSIPYGVNKAELVEAIAQIVMSRKMPLLLDVKDISTDDVRIEQGDAAREEKDVRPLTDFELAARMSCFLWSSTPDDELLRLAEAGELRLEGPLPGPSTVDIAHGIARHAIHERGWLTPVRVVVARNPCVATAARCPTARRPTGRSYTGAGARRGQEPHGRHARRGDRQDRRRDHRLGVRRELLVVCVGSPGRRFRRARRRPVSCSRGRRTPAPATGGEPGGSSGDAAPRRGSG